MSKLGKIPMVVPKDVKIEVKGDIITVKGPLGELKQKLRKEVKIAETEKGMYVNRTGDTSDHRAYQGLFRRLIENMVVGVLKGFEKQLEIVGVGYRAKTTGKALDLQIGYSHPLKHPIPEGIKIEVKGNTNIIVKGIDKQLVGETAACIRRYYPPEPYKGKGIRYKGEYVRRKAGKAIGGKKV